jgi:prepilin-type N-terminal cleavage/methylation domain-containing protein
MEAGSKGFTLVEMLFAVALLGAIAIGVGAVLKRVTSMRDALRAEPDQGAWAEHAIDCLRQDLLQAQRIRIGDDSLEIQGYGALDGDLQRRHIPVHVTYHIQGSGEHTLLTRLQSPMTEKRSQQVREMLAFDANELALEPVVPEDAEEAPPRSSQEDSPKEWRAPPARLRVRIGFADDAEKTIDQVLLLEPLSHDGSS